MSAESAVPIVYDVIDPEEDKLFPESDLEAIQARIEYAGFETALIYELRLISDALRNVDYLECLTALQIPAHDRLADELEKSLPQLIDALKEKNA
jgi:hypothetical protein